MNTLRTIYKKITGTHMIVVQSLQTGLLMGTGDLLAQTIIEKKSFKHIHLNRTGKFFILGTCLVGPALSIWYRFLARTIGKTGSGTSSVIKKVAVDQLIFAPSFLVIFLVAINTLESHSWEFTREQINLKYKDVLLANYKLWPAVQFFNFYVMPLHHQVLFVQGVALVWNAYLSWKVQQGLDDDDTDIRK